MKPLPPPPEPFAMARFCKDLMNWLTGEFLRYTRKDEAVQSIYLISPSKKVYQITVTDAGVVTTTLVQS